MNKVRLEIPSQTLPSLLQKCFGGASKGGESFIWHRNLCWRLWDTGIVGMGLGGLEVGNSGCTSSG